MESPYEFIANNEKWLHWLINHVSRGHTAADLALHDDIWCDVVLGRIEAIFATYAIACARNDSARTHDDLKRHVQNNLSGYIYKYLVARDARLENNVSYHDEWYGECAHDGNEEISAQDRVDLVQLLREILSTDEFNLIWFHFVGGMSIRKIASTVGMPESSLRGELKRVIRKCQTELGATVESLFTATS